MLGVAGQRRQNECEKRVCRRHVDGHNQCCGNYWNVAEELRAAFEELQHEVKRTVRSERLAGRSLLQPQKI